MSLTPPPKAKLSNKAPLQGPLGPCLPPRSSGSSVVGLEVSSGAQNPKNSVYFETAQYFFRVLLRNCYVCLYGSKTGKKFDLKPPSLEDYMSW